MHWKVISIDFWNLNTAYHQVTHTITQPNKDNKHNVNLFAKYDFTLYSRISMLVNTMHIAHVSVHTSYCIRINHNISFASFICVRWKFKHSQQNSKQSLLYWVRFECSWKLRLDMLVAWQCFYNRFVQYSFSIYWLKQPIIAIFCTHSSLSTNLQIFKRSFRVCCPLEQVSFSHIITSR